MRYSVTFGYSRPISFEVRDIVNEFLIKSSSYTTVKIWNKEMVVELKELLQKLGVFFPRVENDDLVKIFSSFCELNRVMHLQFSKDNSFGRELIEDTRVMGDNILKTCSELIKEAAPYMSASQCNSKYRIIKTPL